MYENDQHKIQASDHLWEERSYNKCKYRYLFNLLLVLGNIYMLCLIWWVRYTAYFSTVKNKNFSCLTFLGCSPTLPPHFCLFLVLVCSDSLILTSSLLSETYFKVSKLVYLAYIQVSPLKHNIKITFHLKEWQILSP